MSVYLGLMSGTSLDGVDAAAALFEGEDERPSAARLLAFRSRSYGDAFRRRLREACRSADPAELSDLNFALGRRFAAAVEELLREGGLGRGDVVAIGSHGQTVWHAPPGEGRPGSTLQIGEAAVVAEETGIPVVADFRVRDVAAGGHGAPLTPYFDALLLASPERSRAIVNVGGMGNLTALPPGGSGETPRAFDTGPGVALLDEAAERLTDGELSFDRDGALAASGSVHPAALGEWTEDPFFGSPPPRSTGRERFGSDRLDGWLSRHRGKPAEDLLATLTELTAWSVAESLAWVDFELEEVYLCGGGARNRELVRRIEERLAPRPVRPLSAAGWDGDAREATAFALLARQHTLGVPASCPWATGARGARVLGKRVPAGPSA